MNPVEIYAYPQYAVVMAILVGIYLALFNPRMLFFVVFALIAILDWKGYFFTRFEVTGSYLNVFDMLLLFGLLASFLLNREDRQPITFLWHLTVADLVLGFVITYVNLGSNYDVLRGARWALNVPLLWLIGQRCIHTRKDARIVLNIVLFGCFVQSMRQCLYVAFFEDVEVSASGWRTLRFLHAGYIVVPLCFLLTSYNKSTLFKLFLYANIGISGVALILTQTRSFWIPQALLIVFGGLILARDKIFRIVLPSALCIVVLSFVLNTLVPNKVDIVDIFLHGRINDFTSGHGREAAIYYELNAWMDGNMIFGQGLGFFYSQKYANLDNVGWSHNGYTAYLSNLGFFGFVIFGVLIPKLGLTKARLLWNSNNEEFRMFGLLTGCLIWFMILESALTPGLLAGFPYALPLIFLGGASSLVHENEEYDEALGRLETAAE